MKRVTLLVCAAAVLVAGMNVAVFAGPTFNGQADHDTTAYGWYAVITGSLFPNGQMYNGTNASGGVMRYINDDASWGYPAAYQNWARDGWFAETSGIALTMRNGGTSVYDNNGIENGTYMNNFYGNAARPSDITPGLYCGYSMSDNSDWIYSGYFKLNAPTVITQITGYFAETYYNAIDLSHGFKFNVDIFSAVAGTGSNAGYLMPANTGAFRGDVLSSDLESGSFSVFDTGEVRHYSGFSNDDDIIYGLTYTLDQPITLAAGEYFFSHNAQVVPAPGAALLGLLGLGMVGLVRRRRAG